MHIYWVHRTKNKVSKMFIVVYFYDPFLFLFGSIYMMKELHTGTLRYTIFIVCDMVCMFSLTEDLQLTIVFIFFSLKIYYCQLKIMKPLSRSVFVCVFKGPSSR